MEGHTLSKQMRGASCLEVLRWEKKRLFLDEAREEFFSVFGREALLDAFEKGVEWVTREYRRVDAGGVVRWLSYTAHLARNPRSGNVQAFGFLQDTERRHAREAALAESARDLPVHGIYGRDMAKKLAENALENGGSPLHMLALVRVFGLAGPEAERRRRFIAMAFALLLGSDCVIGERGEDAFTVFRPDAAPRAVTRQRMDEAFAFVRQTLSDGGVLTAPRFVAAVACADLCGTDYDELLERAQECCAAWESAAADSVIFLDGVDAPVAPRPVQQSGRQTLPEEFGATRLPSVGSLSDEEKDVALACLSALLADDSPDVTMVPRAFACVRRRASFRPPSVAAPRRRAGRKRSGAFRVPAARPLLCGSPARASSSPGHTEPLLPEPACSVWKAGVFQRSAPGS